MQAQLNQAKRLKEEQERAKILLMAGIDPDSDAASEFLSISSDSKPGVSEATETPLRERKDGKQLKNRKGTVFTEGLAELGDTQDSFQSPSQRSSVRSMIEKMKQDGKLDGISLVNDISDEVAPRKAKRNVGVEEVTEAEIDDVIARFNAGEDVKGTWRPEQAARMKKGHELNINETDELEDNTENEENSEPVQVCQRCHKLQHYGSISDSLRPGWSSNEFLTPGRFVKLLSGVKTKPCVVLCLVDVFDLQGSLLTDLKGVAGSNPVVVAANKVCLAVCALPHTKSYEVLLLTG
jgi:hypothetical protein